MKQFVKILSFELKNHLKNKVFVCVTVLLVILAAALFFPRISAVFKSKDAQDSSLDNRSAMLVKAKSSTQAKIIKDAFDAAFKDYYVQSTQESPDKIKEKITSGNVECAFVITGDTSYTYYVNNLSIHDTNTSVANEVLRNIYQVNAMIGSGMTPKQAGDVMSVHIEGTTENLGVDQMQNYWYTYIMIFSLYMVILLYGQMVATNVATEKSSRAMEVLITSAKPVSMMFGKVLASCLAGLIQIVAVFGSAILFYSLNKEFWSDNQIIASIFDMPLELFGFMLLFFVLGFLIYAFMFGAVGSTVSKIEDINTSVMPVTFLFIIGFFVVMVSFMSGQVDNTLMKVCSFVPFTSSMAMFTRIAMSTVPWYEIAISIAILIGSVFGVGVISAKIYRVGVLLYGTKLKLTSIIKAVLKA